MAVHEMNYFPLVLKKAGFQILHLKNMLSRSCIQLIDRELSAFPPVIWHKAELGQIRFRLDREEALPELEALMEKLGFPPLQNPEIVLVEKAKTAAIELIFLANNSNSLIRNSDYIADKLGQPYDRISRLFSKHCGITLERYILLLKMEKTKELLLNGEYTLSEISFLLGYSSVQYLSRQFKQICGLTVSEFLEDPSRCPRKAVEELIYY